LDRDENKVAHKLAGYAQHVSRFQSIVLVGALEEAPPWVKAQLLSDASTTKYEL